MIYADRFYFESAAQNQRIIEKIPKFPISFDLSQLLNFFILKFALDLFYNFYDPKKEKSGYKEFVNYLYEMGESMKMLSLRQINEQSLTSTEKALPKNSLHFDNGFLTIKDVLSLPKFHPFWNPSAFRRFET